MSGLAAVILDMDGVITDTAGVHGRAWKQAFDEVLAEHAAPDDARLFDMATDYPRFVDGRPRYEGARTFLESRGIFLPYGEPSDPPDAATVSGVGNRKDLYFHQLLREHSPEVYESTLESVRGWRESGMRVGVMTSSRNGREVLASAGVGDLFDAMLDGVDAAGLGLPGKPDPAMFVEAAHRLGVEPAEAVIVEDAIAGVEAGRRGGFGLVVGIDRAGVRDELRAAGADIVVDDLGELQGITESVACAVPRVVRRALRDLPSALDDWAALELRIAGRPVALFLDYDGTLSPIVSRPEDAVPEAGVREAVARLAVRAPVAVVSGRDARDVCDRLGVDGVYCAGSHGFEILGPDGERVRTERDAEFEGFLPRLDEAEARLRRAVRGIEGAIVERKRYGVAVHYRLVAPERTAEVIRAADETAAAVGGLRVTGGKMVRDLRPDVDWHKGSALLHLMRSAGLGEGRVAVYVGDDATDEDAFAALPASAVGIVVGDDDRETSASFRLRGTDEVRAFLERLADREDAR